MKKKASPCFRRDQQINKLWKRSILSSTYFIERIQTRPDLPRTCRPVQTCACTLGLYTYSVLQVAPSFCIRIPAQRALSTLGAFHLEPCFSGGTGLFLPQCPPRKIVPAPDPEESGTVHYWFPSFPSKESSLVCCGWCCCSKCLQSYRTNFSTLSNITI